MRKQTSNKKAVIFAPFWGYSGHVGNYRVDRFVRWLSADGFHVVIVRAGSNSDRCEQPWGVELTVRDALGLYRNASVNQSPIKERRPNRLRRLMAYCIFNPDPTVIWAKSAAKDSMVLKESRGALFVLSSSPPESSHIGASILAKKLQNKLIVDMRDGWLDEPLKPLLRTSAVQRWREGILESAVMRQADSILVTSSVWKSLLATRLPYLQDKIKVLTNGYPSEIPPKSNACKRDQLKPIHLLHAGRFTGSRLTQKVEYLLKPLLLSLSGVTTSGLITLLGNLEEADLAALAIWRPQFLEKGWSIDVQGAVPRDEMMRILQQADGLLLLSASHAAIPSKLFEYLPLGKPVFAATLRNSAVWEIGSTSKQLFLADYSAPDVQVGRSFLASCAAGVVADECDVPDCFSESYLGKYFIEKVVHR